MDTPLLILSMRAVFLSRAFFAVQHVGSCISTLAADLGETATMLEIVLSKTI